MKRLAFLLWAATLPLAAATFTVTNTDDAGPGSLRQAILDAEGSAGADTIAFAIPGAGVIRADLARGLRDGEMAVSVGWTR